MSTTIAPSTAAARARPACERDAHLRGGFRGFACIVDRRSSQRLRVPRTSRAAPPVALAQTTCAAPTPLARGGVCSSGCCRGMSCVDIAMDPSPLRWVRHALPGRPRTGQRPAMAAPAGSPAMVAITRAAALHHSNTSLRSAAPRVSVGKRSCDLRRQHMWLRILRGLCRLRRRRRERLRGQPRDARELRQLRDRVLPCHAPSQRHGEAMRAPTPVLVRLPRYAGRAASTRRAIRTTAARATTPARRTQRHGDVQWGGSVTPVPPATTNCGGVCVSEHKPRRWRRVLALSRTGSETATCNGNSCGVACSTNYPTGTPRTAARPTSGPRTAIAAGRYAPARRPASTRRGSSSAPMPVAAPLPAARHDERPPNHCGACNNACPAVANEGNMQRRLVQRRFRGGVCTNSVGTGCNTGKSGVCAAGTIACSGGSLVCVQAAAASRGDLRRQ